MRTLLAILVAVLALILPLAPASASDPPVSCPPGYSPADGGCVINIETPGDGGGEGGDTGVPVGGGDSGGGRDTCMYGEVEIPCSVEGAVWNGSKFCYARVLDPQPPKSDGVWEGNEDGVIIRCEAPSCLLSSVADECYADEYWAPGAPAAGPSPRELADRAVAQMNLAMGEIGSTPPSTTTSADSMGIVGLPLWFWIADPGPSTTGPITRSASGGGITVSATATLDRVEWVYTDRQSGAVVHSVTCAGSKAPGTAWTADTRGDGKRPSPTCGIPANQNNEVGQLTLTGTAYWTVSWAGGGQSGTIEPAPMTRSTPVRIGELQVLLADS